MLSELLTGIPLQSLDGEELEDYAKLLANTDPEKLEKIQQIQKKCIQMAGEIVKAGEGGLFVIGETKHYSTLFPPLFEKSNVTLFDKGIDKVLVKLGQIDGAVVIDPEGKIKAYGAHLTRQIVHSGHGTRHAAAKGISMQPGVTAILASQEGKTIRIFKNGVKLVEIDPYTKGVENHTTKIVQFINRPETALVTGAAVGSSVLGIALLPGIVVFAGSYLIAKKLFNMTKNYK